MPGGGVALLYASRTLAGLREGMTSFDQQIGVDIVHNALKVPLKTIANNAGARPSCHTFAMHDPCPLCVVNAVETKSSLSLRIPLPGERSHASVLVCNMMSGGCKDKMGTQKD